MSEEDTGIVQGDRPDVGMAMQRPIFMPEVFTGEGREWSDWLEQFEAAAEINCWGEPQKLKFTTLLLSRRARELYRGLPVEARGNFCELKAAMGRYLTRSGSSGWSRLDFSNRHRQSRESVRDFGNAVSRFAEQAYINLDVATQDILAQDHFIMHVGDGDLRIQLRSAKRLV